MMECFKKLILVGATIVLLHGCKTMSLQPFEFVIAGFPEVEVLDMNGRGRTIIVLASDKFIYRIDLDDKRVTSADDLTMLTNPTSFSYSSHGDILVIDSINDKESHLVKFNPYRQTAKVLTTFNMKIKDILYDDGFVTKFALLTGADENLTFSINKDGSLGELIFEDVDSPLYYPTQQFIEKRAAQVIGLNITNISSDPRSYGYPYSFSSQTDRAVYIVSNKRTEPIKINTDKIPVTSHVITTDGAPDEATYLIIAYKNEPGLTFNAIGKKKKPTREWANPFCSSQYHLDELTPVIDRLAARIEEKFQDKNKDNPYYLTHPFNAYQKYHYVNKKESFDIVEQELGCKLTQPDPYYERTYSSECATPRGLAYKINGYGKETGIFDVSIKKDKTHCYVSFRHRKAIDFRAKSEGKNAGYVGYCGISSCINIRQ